MRHHDEKENRGKLYISIPVQPTDGSPDLYQLKFFSVLKKDDHAFMCTEKGKNL